ncbi:hypothetical protein HYC85_031086 [Camellia sinensis]|uniref:Plastocyanin-like domain-containing protein n=1 Tax=Camellia sinensis TaxID=4442 RepID=A0A7J7FPU5_CAMSI|nr:hypothetical protein HYC85_031086 [Camellia sinensis]
MLSFNTTVDIILQNANSLAVNTKGKFLIENDEKSFNLKNLRYRNTAVVFPFGWTALRFVANNPGVWAFHCHIEPHLHMRNHCCLHMGMGVVFAEGVRPLGKIPNEVLTCGLTGKMFSNNKND